MNLQEIEKKCTHFLTGHYRKTPYEILSEITANMCKNTIADVYGQKKVIEDFENMVAKLLGKPASVFMPSGTMAQQISLRIWAQRKNNDNFGFHPKSHLELHEHKGYQFLHNLKGIYIGTANRLISIEDLQNLSVPISALLLELPQREIGGLLPTWEELTAISEWAKTKNIALHMDGARLWECKPYYQREYSEICNFFDTVYVSFYKGLGGIAGAILAGDSDIIAETKIWKRRHGGDIIHLYPYILSAQQSLEKRLPRMEDYHKKAIAIAQVLNSIPNIVVTPKVPVTNMMHVYLKGEISKLQQKSKELAQSSQTWLFNRLVATELPGYCKFELSVGDATMDVKEEEVKRLFTELMNDTV